MDDFIFGSLSTEALRRAHLHKLRGGVSHHSARSPRNPHPGQPVTLELTVGPTFSFDRAWVYWSMDGLDPLGAQGKAVYGFVTPMEPAGSEWDLLEWGYVRRFRAVLPGQPAGSLVRYRLAAGAKDGPEELADGGTFYAFFVGEDSFAEWVKDAVVYQLMVDRFSPGVANNWLSPQTPAGFYGGTLQGVTENLDYLAELGATALWLTPVFPSPSHHGYDATDYFSIEPRLGTKADFTQLLTSAHDHGIRVLLDFVPNHLSSQHPFFRQAQADPNSPYVSWFNFQHWPYRYECFFGVPDLPLINLRTPGARQYLLDAARYWLDFGIDGFRLDYAIGPTPDFWADFRQATRLKRPDCWTFGEVVEPPDSQIAFHGLLDGCLDFMLLEAFRQTFAFSRWSAARFASFLDRHEEFFPSDFSRPSFLDNHDMNRFLWAAQGDQRRLKIAALCQFTLSGPPVIYYGTEVGLSQKRDVRQGERGLPEESRLPMLWGEDQDKDLLGFYRQLIQLRKQHDCLRRGERQTLYLDPDCLAYVRQFGGMRLLTVINLSLQQKSIIIPDDLKSIVIRTESGCLLDASTSLPFLQLPPLSGVSLRP